MQFGFMPERGAIDVVFIMRRMQEEYHDKGKTLYMCFVILRKLLREYRGKIWILQ